MSNTETVEEEGFTIKKFVSKAKKVSQITATSCQAEEKIEKPIA